MKIQLLHNYGGRRTNEQRIPPGVYDASDERLFGLAQYLVENDHAVIVESDESPVSEDELIPVNPPAEPAPAKPSKAKARK